MYVRNKTGNYKQHFELYIEHADKTIVRVALSSDGEIKYAYERKTEVVAGHRIWNAKEYENTKKKLKHQFVKSFLDEILSSTNIELKSDGYSQNLRNTL